ncbi:MAG: hypothetical protein Q8R54_04740 [Methylobacter sp.]|nr:hypothetical protein [Methylobacter sp.]
MNKALTPKPSAEQIGVFVAGALKMNRLFLRHSSEQMPNRPH